ncbi:MAG: GDP-fucose synthetase [Flavobacteriales bacterium]|nr:GDP-fucose synthetase [Flavobacteriales bacterium]
MNNSNNSTKIMIAGASGMVGNAIKRRYLKAEKYNSQMYEILTPSRNELNLLNFEEVKNWFEENCPDIVILAAAKVGGIFANKNNPADFILHNLKIQTNLIEISNNFKVKKFLFLGSSCIYPRLATQPITEKDLLSGQLEITNEFYAIAKIAGIKLCQALAMQKGFNSICLMPTNLYGPGDNYHKSDSHVLPSLIKKFSEAKNKKMKNVTCWGDGSPLREFLYVDDLAEACFFAMENLSQNSKYYPKDKNGKPLFWINVGSNQEISIKNLAGMIAKLVGYEGSIIWDKTMPNGTPRKKLDTSVLDKLGWKSKTNLEEGIKLTLKAYNSDLGINKLRT